MRRFWVVTMVLALALGTVVSVLASSTDAEKIRFRVNVTAPESFIDRTESGCQYAAGPQTLHIRSSSGDYAIVLVFNGKWVGTSSTCWFSDDVALDVGSDQEFTFNQREWFTVPASDLERHNRIDIHMAGVGVPDYELQMVGIVTTVAPTPTPDPEIVFTTVASVDNVDLAEQATFANRNSGYLFTEPWDFYVNTYRFDSDETASSAMPAICDHIEKQSFNSKKEGRVDAISVGRIGNETCAFFIDEDSQGLYIATRIDNHILTVYAFASDGDTVGFTSEWLEGYVESIPDNAESVMPTLSDLPRGWVETRAVEDVTEQTTP